MNRQPSRRQWLGAAMGLAARASESLPNIVLIVADDLGWADVGYHGSSIRTPTLDRLAGEGAELNQHYVAPLCTPTRAALLTGRYWSRFGNTSPQATQVLPFGTETLASALRSRGYETCISGKWHLGSLPEWGPRKFGFGRSYGALGGGTGPWDHRYKEGPYSRNWHRNDEYVEERGHVTDLIAREAAAFIQSRRTGPFFLYLPFTAVHHPIDEPAEWLQAAGHVEPERRQYAACVQHMDDAVRKVVAALEHTGARKNTLIVFTSDNGGMGLRAGKDLSSYPGRYEDSLLGENRPLRGHKGQVYEGGIRVPAFANWPGRIAARRIGAPVHAVDWTPTLARLGGFAPPSGAKWDGRDVWPLLTGTANGSVRDLYWRGPRSESFAYRSGDWKLVVHGGKKERKVELFHLGRDPYEQRDAASVEPRTVARLEALLARQQGLDGDAVVKAAAR